VKSSGWEDKNRRSVSIVAVAGAVGVEVHNRRRKPRFG
jgi:hypothetical protein